MEPETQTEATKDFEVFYLDGFSWTDLLDFLGIPHYSNSHRTDQPVACFEIRTVQQDQMLVMWPPEKPRPTDEQILAVMAEDMGDIFDDEEEFDEDDLEDLEGDEE